MNYKEFVKTHQQTIVLSVGYLLVGILAFGLGRMTGSHQKPPEIRVEQAFTLPNNYSPNIAGVQTSSPDQSAGECEGKIKGNISGDSKIYHVPGGSFYNRTNPEMCFETESQAQAAGFRKSSR